MKWILLAIALLLVAFGIVFFWPQTNALVCKIKGGSWADLTTLTENITGPNDAMFCKITYSDGGKTCSSSSECQGGCYVLANGKIATQGVCAQNNATQFNCPSQLIEKQRPDMDNCLQ